MMIFVIISNEKTEHPCQIPEEIIRRIILTTAKPNELIIDTFGGSGTTCKVANEIGHDSLVFEIDPLYCQIIENRLKNTKKNQIKLINE